MRLLSAPPIVVGRYRATWPAAILPYALGALVAAGLCSFFFVSGPQPPEAPSPGKAAVLQQPASSGMPSATVSGSQIAGTMQAIEAPQDVVVPQRPAPGTPLSQQEVFEVQLRLQELRFDPGPVDGVAGPRTTNAIRRYQARKGQTQTGALDRELLDTLRSEQTAAR